MQYDAKREHEENIIGKRLAHARRAHGLTLKKFSDLLQAYGVVITDRGINKWEKGDSVPNAYQIIACFLALDFRSIEELGAGFRPEMNDIGLAKLMDYKKDLIASGRYEPIDP